MTVINIHLGDSLDAMKSMKENQYDLAIVDPEYGINEHGKGKSRHRNSNPFTEFENKGWDKKRPEKIYFDEVIRVSNDQIIFGGNYFADYLEPTMGWIFWDKLLGGDFSDGELIYTSFNRALRKFVKSPEKNYSTNKYSATKWKRIHPCQKPVALYKWLLKNYAKEGDKILDTHFGSLSIGIACIEMGFDLDCWEIDEEYFDAAVKRIQNHVKQLNAFIPQPEINIFKPNS